MKILHTADWHLGRILGGRDLLPDQKHTLEHLVEIARQQSVDAIVIAGDIYDRAQPSEEAINLFGKVLTELRGIAQVLCIAGNHDSAGRISFASGLLAASGVHMAGNEVGAPVYVDVISEKRATDKVRFHLMPYATPEEVRTALTVDAIRTHSDAIEKRVPLCTLATDCPNVLVAHLFAQGCHPSDSERDIAVGGIAQVDTALFKKFAYTALGHLHEPHDVPKTAGTTGKASYSGSICRYSFSEEKHEKSVTIVTIDSQGAMTTQHLPLKQTVGMRSIKGKLEKIVAAAILETPEVRARDLVRIELTDTAPIGPTYARLRDLYPNMLEYSHAIGATTIGKGRITEDQLRSGSPIEHFKTFFAEFAEHLTETEKSDTLAAACDCMEVATKDETK